MKVFFTGLREPAVFTQRWVDGVVDYFEKNKGDHERVFSWEEADRIFLLYGSDYLWGLSQDEKRMLKRKSESIFVWSPSDEPAFLFPGLYANLPFDRFQQGRFRSYCFPAFNQTLEETRNEKLQKKWNVSFSGAPTCNLRKKLFQKRFVKEDVLIENTQRHQEWNPLQPDWIESKKRYSRNLLQSRFVLCPRGAGVGSIRLFETLQAGAVPVVLSDRYVFPEGPRWEKFIVQIPESRIHDWENELSARNSEAGEMGRVARSVWEEWFAPSVWFMQIMKECDLILKLRTGSELRRQTFWPAKRMVYRVRTDVPKFLREIKRKIKS